MNILVPECPEINPGHRCVQHQQVLVPVSRAGNYHWKDMLGVPNSVGSPTGLDCYLWMKLCRSSQSSFGTWCTFRQIRFLRSRTCTKLQEKDLLPHLPVLNLRLLLLGVSPIRLRSWTWTSTRDVPSHDAILQKAMTFSDKLMTTMVAHPVSTEQYTPWMEIRRMDIRQIIRGSPGLTPSTHPGFREPEQRRWLHVVCRHWGSEHSSTLSQQCCLARTAQSDFWMKGDTSLYKPLDIPPDSSLLTSIKPTVQRQANTSFN